MHQLATQIRLTALPHEPARKIGLEERDLGYIATAVFEGMSQGLCRDLLVGQTKAEAIRFLRRLASKCDFEHFDAVLRRLKGKRGLGYGADILDRIIKSVGRQCFRLIVHCPANNELFFAMLASRGFSFAGRYCRGQVLVLRPTSSQSGPAQMSRRRPVGLTN